MAKADIFPVRFKKLRKKQGMTQYQVADRLNVTRSAIGHYEDGIRRPDIDMLVKIADVLYTSADYLLGRTEEEMDATRQ